ncbi:hypothetical protein [Rhizohabitans arisaemae]|uniref:hypothetical protein n=1 Tax=Rhizohabitans arisaemae TaxID=2720610 RepID=UPI0024B09483|nr:hypothetical protein [Rhizohabitans arisaemae]
MASDPQDPRSPWSSPSESGDRAGPPQGRSRGLPETPPALEHAPPGPEGERAPAGGDRESPWTLPPFTPSPEPSRVRPYIQGESAPPVMWAGEPLAAPDGTGDPPVAGPPEERDGATREGRRGRPYSRPYAAAPTEPDEDLAPWGPWDRRVASGPPAGSHHATAEPVPEVLPGAAAAPGRPEDGAGPPEVLPPALPELSRRRSGPTPPKGPGRGARRFGPPELDDEDWLDPAEDDDGVPVEGGFDPVPEDVLAADGTRRRPTGRHKRRGFGDIPPERRRLLVPIVVVAGVAALAGAGALVLNAWSTPPEKSLIALAAGEARLGDAQFKPPPDVRGDGARQVLNGAAAWGSTVVVVGSDSTAPVPRPLFIVSVDGGKRWRLGQVTGSSGSGLVGRVVGGAGGWLAISTDAGGPGPRGMWVSKDGQSWAGVDSARLTAFGPNELVHDVVRTQSGYLVVGASAPGADGRRGPAAWTSPDGIGWKRVDPSQIGASSVLGGIRAVVARGDSVVALAEAAGDPRSSILMMSPDGGQRWQRVGGRFGRLRPESGGLALARGGFVLLPAFQRPAGSRKPVPVYCSRGGVEWKECGGLDGLAADGLGVRDLTTSKAGMAALVETGLRRFAVYTSTDGRRWRRSTDLGSVSGRLRGLALTDGGTVVVGGDEKVGDLDNRPVLLTAAKGRRTAVRVPPQRIPGLRLASRGIYRLAVGAQDRMAVVGGSAGDAAVWTSPNGNTWSRARGGRAVFGGDNRQELLDVVSGPHGWLAVGSTQTTPSRTEPLLVASADGVTWRKVSVRGDQPADHPALRAFAVAAGPKGYVVAGEDQSTTATVAALWHSPDGKRFTRVTPPNGGQGVRIHDVAATPGGFAAVGGTGSGDREKGVAWVSADGVTWSPAPWIVPEEAAGAGLRHVVARGPELVAVGTALQDGRSRPFAALSADGGREWSTHLLPADEPANVDDLAAGPDGLVAVGSAGPPGAEDSAAWVSVDGRTWESQTFAAVDLMGAGVQRLGTVAVSGNQVVAIGRSTTYSADHLTVWRTSLNR